MKSQAILTFDLEFWYESISLKKYLHHQENLLDEEFNQLVLLILNELKKNNHQATFFTTGQVMRKCPELIRKIDQLGHEIALHGYSHNGNPSTSRCIPLTGRARGPFSRLPFATFA